MSTCRVPKCLNKIRGQVLLLTQLHNLQIIHHRVFSSGSAQQHPCTRCLQTMLMRYHLSSADVRCCRRCQVLVRLTGMNSCRMRRRCVSAPCINPGRIQTTNPTVHQCHPMTIESSCMHLQIMGLHAPSDNGQPHMAGDWRAFRAKLVQQEVVEKASALQRTISDEEGDGATCLLPRISESNKRLLKIQNPNLASEDTWCHESPGIEPVRLQHALTSTWTTNAPHTNCRAVPGNLRTTSLWTAREHCWNIASY